jgi:hypothetical protein
VPDAKNPVDTARRPPDRRPLSLVAEPRVGRRGCPGQFEQGGLIGGRPRQGFASDCPGVLFRELPLG